MLGLPVASASSTTAEYLAKNFLNPPPEARPWVYAFWVNGNVTREGITSDLEAMKRVGIGGINLMEVNLSTPDGPVRFGTPQWREMFKFTVSEADRLGLKVTMNNDAGWAGSGGPWNTPEHSEQHLVWTETLAQGPAHYEAVLPKPQPTSIHSWHEPSKEITNAIGGFYKDVALLAFPTPPLDEVSMAEFSPTVTASAAQEQGNLQEVISGKNKASLTLPKPEPGNPQYVQISFARAFTARTLDLSLDRPLEWSPIEGEVQISDDGNVFRTIHKFSGPVRKLAMSFDAVKSRYFRILFTRGDKKTPSFKVCGVHLNPHIRIDGVRQKTFVDSGRISPSATYPELPRELVIDKKGVIDLTSKMDQEGRLKWEMPPGRWTLLRMGHNSTAVFTHPAPKEGLGLECDKLSKEAVDAHFAGLMGKLVAEVGSLAGKTLVGTHIDSWETGTQNWTARFREEFQARRGYDLLRFLPVMTGRVIESQEISERFLWDVRQTVAELLLDNYAGRFQELAHQQGLKLSIESYGNGPYSDLAYGARADVPMSEFWWKDDVAAGTTVAMSSIAHVYGKPIVQAEAFTANSYEKWLAHPATIKSNGDWAFCMGANRLVIHRYAMQPWPERKPGIAMGPFGLHYEQTQTWWELSAPWHQYLTRCQYLLQQGLCVADICYLQAEGAPQSFAGPLSGVLPDRPGYAFDGVSAEALCSRFSVKDGKLVLPDGMSYRVLVLPEAQTMTPTLLRKIKELVAEGATVIGPKPLKSPSLADYPAGDVEIKTLSDELWANCDGKVVKEHPFGKGRILWGITPQEVLAKMNVPPDFVYRDSKSETNLLYVHHTVGDADFYFVANRKADAVEGFCQFRVQGKQLELWHPQTGQIEPVAAYEEKDGVTNMPIHLDATESAFVVFRPNPKPFDAVASVTLDGIPTSIADIRLAADNRLILEARKPGAYEIKTISGKTRKAAVEQVAAPVEITGPWAIKFPPNWGAPASAMFEKLASWSDHSDPGVKYFSGTAVYEKTIQIPTELIGKGRRLYLDLGDVQVIAEVKLNGKALGILWKPPFRVDLTGAVKPDDNALEIKVTNLWPNRLIGDEQLAEDSERNENGSLSKWPQWLLDGKPSPTGRLTFTSWRLWKKNDPLLKSGLLGPVTLFSSVECAMPSK